MNGRVKWIVVHEDWNNMRSIMLKALEKVGAFSHPSTYPPAMHALMEEDAERCDNGLPPKREDPLEVRLDRAERSMRIAKQLMAGKRVDGASTGVVGGSSNWALAVNCYDRLTYCDVSIVALSTPSQYWPAKIAGSDSALPYPTDLSACQRKAEEIAALLQSGTIKV